MMDQNEAARIWVGRLPDYTPFTLLEARRGVAELMGCEFTDVMRCPLNCVLQRLGHGDGKTPPTIFCVMYALRIPKPEKIERWCPMGRWIACGGSPDNRKAGNYIKLPEGSWEDVLWLERSTEITSDAEATEMMSDAEIDAMMWGSSTMQQQQQQAGDTAMQKTQAFEMSRDEWFDDGKYPYWPNERDYKKHGKALLQRHDFNKDHPTLGQNCALITVQGVGTFKGNAMTTTYLAKQGKCNYPARVHGVHYYVNSMEEGQVVYNGFDNPASVKGSKDRVLSALKAAGLTALSNALNNGDGMTAISIVWHAIHGRRANHRPDSDGIEVVVRMLKQALDAVDDILVVAEKNRSGKVAKSTPILGSMLLTFLKIYNLNRARILRDEKIREWEEFWTNFVISRGIGSGELRSSFNVLWNKMAAGIKGSGGNREVSFDWTEKALWAFERRDDTIGDRLSHLSLKSYYVMSTRKTRLGETVDLGRKATKTADTSGAAASA